MVEVQRPRHLAALRGRDRLQPHTAGSRVREIRVIAAHHQGEDPEDLTRGLCAGKVDLRRLGGYIGILARSVSLALHRGHAGRPRGTAAGQGEDEDGDGHCDDARRYPGQAPAREAGPVGIAATMADEFLGALVMRVRMTVESLAVATICIGATTRGIRRRVISGRHSVGITVGIRVVRSPAPWIMDAVAARAGMVIGVRSHLLTSGVRPLLGESRRPGLTTSRQSWRRGPTLPDAARTRAVGGGGPPAPPGRAAPPRAPGG